MNEEQADKFLTSLTNLVTAVKKLNERLDKLERNYNVTRLH